MRHTKTSHVGQYTLEGGLLNVCDGKRWRLPPANAVPCERCTKTFSRQTARR